MRHSLKTIAKLAGVSPATVSLALRDDPRVADSTRSRVTTLASELGYVPNHIGRALQASQSSLVGFSIPTLSHSYYNEILEGCGAAAGDRGYGILVAMPSGDPEEHLSAFRMFQEKSVDGIILATHHSNLFTEVQKTRSLGTPVVFAGSGPSTEIAPLIKNDDTATGRMAAEHLLDLGHSNIAYCYAPSADHERYSGTLDACLDAGAGCRRLKSADELRSLSNSPHPPTAIIAYSDDIAVEVVEILRSLGFGVPEDVSVIGVDDSPAASLPAYDLTTIAPRKREIGALALEFISKELNGERTTSAMLLPEIVVRSSAAPPRQSPVS